MKIHTLLYVIVIQVSLTGCMSYGEKYRCADEKKFACKALAESVLSSGNGAIDIVSTFTEYYGGDRTMDGEDIPECRILVIGVKYKDKTGILRTKYFLFNGPNVPVIEYKYAGQGGGIKL